MKNLNKEALLMAIKSEYTEVAKNPAKGFHFISGYPLTRILEYTDEMLLGVPEGAIESFAGVGNPFKIGSLRSGETVVDIGCGAGIDSLIASKMVGKKGKVYGVDMTEEMLGKARRNAKEMGAENVKFINAYAEALPFEDASVDVVISNGVINLTMDKTKIFDEIFRILKPGGRFQIADVILENPVGDRSKDLAYLWTNCVAGGELLEDYIKIIRNSALWSIVVLDKYDVFKGAPVASSAQYFGAKGYNIRGYKPILMQLMWEKAAKRKLSTV